MSKLNYTNNGAKDKNPGAQIINFPNGYPCSMKKKEFYD